MYTINKGTVNGWDPNTCFNSFNVMDLCIL